MRLPSFKLFGERALLLEWPADISEELYTAISNCHDLLSDQLGPFIEEMVPAYASLAIFLKPSAHISDFIRLIEASTFPEAGERVAGRLIEVPVCYDPPFSLDLEEVAGHCRLDTETVISLHSSTTYLVHFIGFLPGFPYLGGLDSRLTVPRKETPRPMVEAGSVAIAGGQAGIYSQNSPGGWQIIGKTPLQLFDANVLPPALFTRGDRLQFKRVHLNKFLDIEKKVRQGQYQPKISTP